MISTDESGIKSLINVFGRKGDDDADTIVVPISPPKPVASIVIGNPIFGRFVLSALKPAAAQRSSSAPVTLSVPQ